MLRREKVTKEFRRPLIGRRNRVCIDAEGRGGVRVTEALADGSHRDAGLEEVGRVVERETADPIGLRPLLNQALVTDRERARHYDLQRAILGSSRGG